MEDKERARSATKKFISCYWQIVQTASSQVLHLLEVFKIHFKCNKGIWQHSMDLEEWSQLNESTNKWLDYCRSGEKHREITADVLSKTYGSLQSKVAELNSTGSSRSVLGYNKNQFFQTSNVIRHFPASWKNPWRTRIFLFSFFLFSSFRSSFFFFFLYLTFLFPFPFPLHSFPHRSYH